MCISRTNEAIARPPPPSPNWIIGKGEGGGEGKGSVRRHPSLIHFCSDFENESPGSARRIIFTPFIILVGSTTEGKKHVSSTFLIISFFGGREGITLLVRRILFETNNDRKRLLLLFLQKNRTWKWKTEDCFPSGLPIPDETNRRRSRKGIHSTHVQFDLFNRPREWHVADTYRFSSYLSTFLSFLYYRTIRIVRCRLAVVDDGGWIE